MSLRCRSRHTSQGSQILLEKLRPQRRQSSKSKELQSMSKTTFTASPMRAVLQKTSTKNSHRVGQRFQRTSLECLFLLSVEHNGKSWDSRVSIQLDVAPSKSLNYLEALIHQEKGCPPTVHWVLPPHARGGGSCWPRHMCSPSRSAQPSEREWRWEPGRKHRAWSLVSEQREQQWQ